MSTQIANARPFDVHPRNTTLEFKVDLGGAIEFRNNSKDFHLFEITFDEPVPPGASKTLTGTSDNPIFVQMPNATSTFTGHMVFKKNDGTTESAPVPFLAHSCVGC
jgi:hypothetical protein